MENAVHFSIKYDGAALQNHTMDVRELAPALIALSDLIEEANNTLFANAEKISINVKGSFKSGSFEVDLVAIASITKQITSLFSGPEASALSNIWTLLGATGLIGGGGLIALFKWLRGRKPKTKIKGERVVFTLEETEETFELDLQAGRLYQNRSIRKSLSKVIKPLENEGIDYFACAHNGELQATVTKEEAVSFESIAEEADIVSDNLLEGVLLEIQSAVFKDGNKWRFSDGQTSFHAEIKDADFLKRVELGEERFGKLDVLVVTLRKVQSVSESGLKLNYEVVQVLEHREQLQTTLNI